MKHLKKAEQRCSDTVAYRYVVGFMLATVNVLKKALLLALKYSTEILIVIALISAVIVAQAFGANAINFTVCILFLTILAVLISSLIKIKILEHKEKDR